MTVEERLEALEKEVQRLKDVQAIKELKSKYFRALDTKNWDELETTMTPNISTAYSNGKLVFHGPRTPAICACMRNPSSATKRTASGSICSARRKRKSSRRNK